MKIAPLLRAIARHNEFSKSTAKTPIIPLLVHTGQHYDYEMSQVFFQDLRLPKPDVYLGVGSGTHAEQTARVMIEFEKVLLHENPDVVVVVGDVNSTLAAALAAVKLHLPVAHVEAGLRHFHKSVPEEVNRLLTDAISDYLFTYSVDTSENLIKEGIPQDKIFFVGNVMIDSLRHNWEQARLRDTYSRRGLARAEYGVLTLHRPDNVDDGTSLKMIISALKVISRHLPIVFPCHPRTSKMIRQFGLLRYFSTEGYRLQRRGCSPGGLFLLPPLGYLDFLNLLMNSRFVVTDSGGIQEETTVLNIPCLTVRDFTARPITVRQGTTVLVGNHPHKLRSETLSILKGNYKIGRVPELWDGKASERIIAVIGRPR